MWNCKMYLDMRLKPQHLTLIQDCYIQTQTIKLCKKIIEWIDWKKKLVSTS
jgi:hypothetical protein